MEIGREGEKKNEWTQLGVIGHTCYREDVRLEAKA